MCRSKKHRSRWNSLKNLKFYDFSNVLVNFDVRNIIFEPNYSSCNHIILNYFFINFNQFEPFWIVFERNLDHSNTKINENHRKTNVDKILMNIEIEIITHYTYLFFYKKKYFFIQNSIYILLKNMLSMCVTPTHACSL